MKDPVIELEPIPSAPRPLGVGLNDLSELLEQLQDPKNESLKKEFIEKYGDVIKLALFNEPEEEILPEPQSEEVEKFKLNDSQQNTYDSIIGNIDTSGIINSIEGSAGTGKSTITSELIKFLYMETRSSVAIVAPTHQALKVIKEMTLNTLGIDPFFFMENSSSEIRFKTTYSFLGLKLHIDEDGNEVFKNMEADKFQEVIYCDYLFVDESSMVDKQMANELISLLGRRVRKQIIFIGDRYQAKPVNGEMNLIFDKRNPLITRYDLTEVVRQKANSAIIKFSQWLVECINDNDQFQFEELIRYFKTGADDIFCYDNVPALLDQYFITETDKVVGCYTNASVKSYNDYIRYINFKDQYPEGIPEYIVGDKLIMLQPYEHNGVLQYNNGDIVTITDLKYKADFKKEMWYWECHDEDGFLFKILDPRYIDILQKQLTFQADIAKKSTGNSRRVHWEKFFKLKNKYAKVRPVYANTFHKLQGSTYTNTFINCDEFIPYLQRDLDNILRLIYVAVTRGRSIHLLKT